MHTYKRTHSCSQASITWTIILSDGRGLPIQSYTLRHAKASSLSSYQEVVSEGTTIVVSNLNASTSYVAWVRACTSAGCSNYSTYSVSASTLAVPATDTLARLANDVQVCVNDFVLFASVSVRQCLCYRVILRLASIVPCNRTSCVIVASC